jgi:hypothetical protein
MSQLFIVTTPQNSGLGTPLATAFNYTNSNFSELYARFQTSVPASLTGQTGDVPGMYAVDETYFYYCYALYDGSSTIWSQVTQVGNISVARIVNGTSNVNISAPNSDVTISASGLSNVAVFSILGMGVLGSISATGNIAGSYILGNGSQLTGLPATYTNANVVSLLNNFGTNAISTTGNVSANNFIGLGTYLSSIPAANITGTVANATYAVSSGSANTVTDNAQPNITSVGTLSSVSVSGNANVGNVNAVGTVISTGNIVTSGFFVGNFTGNVVATLTNIPGPGGAVVFNDGTGNAAATAGLIFDSSGPNVLTVLGSYSATANVSANIVSASLIAGTLSTAAQPNVTSLGNLTSLTVTGNTQGGNLLTAGQVSAAGNVTTATLLAASASVSGTITSASTVGGIITGSSVSASGNVTANNFIGTVATATQPNITGLGTLASLSVTGNVQGGNLRTTGQLSSTGNITSSGNLRGGNLTVVTDIAAGGNVSAGLFTGSSMSVVGNITTTATISAGGNITGNYFLGNGSQLTGISLYSDSNVVSLLSSFGSNSISTTGSVSADAFVGGSFNGQTLSLVGNIAAGNITGTLLTASQTAITQVGTLTSLSVTGNINSGNLTTGTVSASGNITAGNVSAASVTGTIATAAQPTITSLGTLTSLSVSGNITGGNISVGTRTVTLGNIVNANANAVGNIGSATGYFNTVFAKATSAQYADLAENYESDSDYPIGTVLIFGGSKEVTTTDQQGDERVAGVVSENPAHLMNAGMPGLPIALRGRVKVRITGPVVKGDSLITSTLPGVAISIGRNREYGQAVFAKAIETDIEDGEKIITAVIL